MMAGLKRIREAAQRDNRLQFTSLLHHVTEELLWDSYLALKRLAAPGIDEVIWQEYYANARGQ